MREIITRYGRDNLGFFWLFVEPMIFTLGVTALWYTTGAHRLTNIPIVAFTVAGYSSVLLWRNCANRCVMAIQPNMGLLYHRNVRVLDLLITRTLLEIAGASISFVVLSSLWISLGWMDLPVDLSLVLCGWVLLAWFGTAVALILGALTAHSEVWERFWGPTTYLLFPLSGAMFMVDWLPHKMQDVILILPMVHGVEMLRAGYFGPIFRAHYDTDYVICVCLVLTLLGLVLVRDAGRRVELQA